MQFDLFSTIGMSAINIEPNPSGVYPDDQAESFVLPVERKNWFGCPQASVRLLHLPAGWLQATSVGTPTGGYTHGLCERFGGGFHPNRTVALANAKVRIIEYLATYYGSRDGAAARRIRDWVEALR